MNLFKTSVRKGITVTVEGEDFLLVKPSVLNRICYLEYVEEVQKGLDEKSSEIDVAKINLEANCRLVAICLTTHFPDVSVEEIHKTLVEQISDYADLNELSNVAGELAGLKIEVTESQEETLGTDSP